MAAKRLFDEGGEGEGEDHHDQAHHKRPKTRFASVIREVVMVNFLENFCSALEPMLRRVVSEEVENGLRRRCPTTTVAMPASRMIENVPVRLQLSFPKPLSLPIFTGTKIVDADGNSLKVLLVDRQSRTLKLEMVVLDGEFPKDGASTWTPEEFSRNIVKERTGKRPLLTGDLSLSMRDGIASVGDIQFTDNSSWIRCRKFRIGARVVCCGEKEVEVVIQEAITQAFVVKDHRGELYKKHHPPGLKDAVWRLEKIGKGGSFHQKLKSHGIHTVQDFLKLYHVHPHNLRKIMGSGMSDKMWETTLKHAKECVVLPNLVYKFHGPADDYILTLNPVCQLLTFQYNGGHLFHYNDLATIQSRAYIQRLVKDAYAKWNTLEIVQRHPTPTPPLILGEEVVEQLQRHPGEGEGEEEEEEMVVRTSSSSSYAMMDSGEGDYSAPTNDHYNGL